LIGIPGAGSSRTSRSLKDCRARGRRDYVSELLSPTDILFIPHMIYEFGERRWNDIDGGKLKN
jgi:hypothetical protein